MTYAELPKLKKNSVPTTLSSGINDAVTDIPVTELSVFHDADGTLITQGIVIGYDNSNDTYAEEITITGASGTSGAGNLTGATRGVNADGSIGAARAWDSGTNIAVMFSTGIYEQIRENDICSATRTTADLTIYVDSAATGAGDGTSWTDAFTTIQGAIDSLPAVIMHAITISVRDGTYTENLAFNTVSNKGSITIKGEFSWSGECTAASSPSATSFQVADTTGMAAGDIICIVHTNGAGAAVGGSSTYKYYVKTTIASVDSATQLTITSGADWGNLGANDVYWINRTSVTGNITCTAAKNIYLDGLNVAGVVSGSDNSSIYLTDTNISGGSRGIIMTSTSYASTIRSYMSGSTQGLYCSESSNVNIGSFSTGYTSATVCVCTAANNRALWSRYNSCAFCSYSVFDSTLYGIAVSNPGGAYVIYSCITADTGTGLYAISNGAIEQSSNNNNATVPKNPASATDGAYIN